MSCIEGISAFIAAGCIATKQFLKVALFATAKDCWVSISNRLCADTIECSPGHHRPQILQPHTGHPLSKTGAILGPSETSYLASSEHSSLLLPGLASMLMEVHDDSHLFPILHTFPCTHHSGLGYADDKMNYCQHETSSVCHFLQQIMHPPLTLQVSIPIFLRVDILTCIYCTSALALSLPCHLFW